MLWPPDHPAVTDAALRPWLGGAAELCPAGRIDATLRHLEGRRVAVRVRTPAGPAVLKVFANPRARGNHRRLGLLAASGARDLVPRTHGADGSGHVSLAEWVPGRPLDRHEGGRLIAACAVVGEALACLHGSGAGLDRRWTATEELALLRRNAVPETAPWMDAAAEVAGRVAGEPLVSAHRDFHPAQVVLGGRGVRLIDLDDAAMAPPALDVGNFVAHLRHAAVVGACPPAVASAAAAAFRAGYGRVEGDVDAWSWLSTIRLAALAQARHGRPDWTRGLLRAAAEIAVAA